MASMENGTTSLSGLPSSELFAAESGFDAGDGGATTTSVPHGLTLAESGFDTGDNGISTPGTPATCVSPPPRVTYYNVIYNMPDRALCGCFARDP